MSTRMANPSKRKGSGFEREIVKLLQEAGIAAERVPLSGAVKGGSFEGDIDFPVRNIDRKGECKRRRRFATLYGWLGANFCLFLREDNNEPLVVMRLSDFAELAK